MTNAERRSLRRMLGRLSALRAEMLTLDREHVEPAAALCPEHRCSARNLEHYLALRRHDLRDLQEQLAELGLSSLGRTESHVLSAVESVCRVLGVLLGDAESADVDTPVDLSGGLRLLEENTRDLLGELPRGRRVRIMVTMSTEAATDYALVRDLLQSGMDCMRINCAHDGPEAWLGMIRNLQRARKETGLPCKIEMDLAGPKVRTGQIEAGPAVVRCRPERDEFGRTVKAARVWLMAGDAMEGGPEGATVLRAPREFVSRLRRGDVIHLRDAREAQRELEVVQQVDGGCWLEVEKTTYFTAGLELHAKSTSAENKAAKGKKDRSWRAQLGAVPQSEQRLTLRPGDMLVVMRSEEPGRLAVMDEQGRVREPARIGVTLPEFFMHVKVGEPICFDDGKIGGVVRAAGRRELRVEITQARAEGERLGAAKGINLPESKITVPALTEEDIEYLPFVVKHADMVAYSFVRTEEDVRGLLARIKALRGERLGVVLKIETRGAFENLPRLILAVMAQRSAGVMIARGDLAVECGYERMAEVQEEILWICEAAHLPVIWATQVLETLSKTGIPSRSEITDAAMGERAECVMLNKGQYVVQAVRALDDILKRMEGHHNKKRSMLRRLHVASSMETQRPACAAKRKG